MQADFLDVRQLAALKAVIDSGSITKAAERLQKSQSAVTRLIQDLEFELGYSVLTRKGPKISPTDHGLNIYQEAERYLAGLSAVSKGAKFLSRNETASLSISTISSVAQTVVPAAVADIVGRSPSANVSVDVTTSEMVTNAIMDRRADIGIIGFAPDTPGLEFHFIGHVPFIGLVPDKDPLAKRLELRPEDFDGRHLIAVSGRYRLRVLFQRAMAQLKVSPASIIIANASYVSAAMANMPGSIALVQSSAIDMSNLDGLRAIPLSLRIPFHFGLITAVGRPLSPIAIEALARMKDHARRLPGFEACESFPEFGQPI